MAIDLGKQGGGEENQNPSNSGNSGGQGSAGQKDYNDPNSHPDVRQIYVFAYECKRKNMPEYQIEQSLMNKGLELDEAKTVIRNVNRVYQQSQQSNSQSDNSGGGSKAMGGLLIIGIIILFDVLSLAFGWGFVIY